MKIQTIHLKKVGPLADKTISFSDAWTGGIASHVLFSGPNGTGKSIILRSIATLWDAVGYWLDNRKKLPARNSTRKWLQQWGGIAIIVKAIPHTTSLVGIVFGDSSWFDALRPNYPTDMQWIGESVQRTGKPGKPKRTLHVPTQSLLESWSEARKKLILTFQDAKTPNLLYLDAEERQWVSPRRNVGQPLSEESRLRWLVKYQATEDWKGQFEASLINLKTVKLHTYHEVVRDLNAFLIDKEIDPQVRPGENRLRVKLSSSGGDFHAIDELSAGEHQILIQIYLISRWLETGGIVMIDEPDLYLHPSLIPNFLAKLESLVDKREGQLLITSHNSDVWQRYESRGKRIRLGEM